MGYVWKTIDKNKYRDEIKKRLNEEKNSLIDTEKRYYDLEKQTRSDLIIATESLKNRHDELEKISKNFSINNDGKIFISYLNGVNKNLENTKIYLDNNNNEEAKFKIKDIITIN